MTKGVRILHFLKVFFSFCISHHHSLATQPPPPPHSFIHLHTLVHCLQRNSVNQAKSFTQVVLTYLYPLVSGPSLHQSTQCNSSIPPSALCCSSPARMLCSPCSRELRPRRPSPLQSRVKGREVSCQRSSHRYRRSPRQHSQRRAHHRRSIHLTRSFRLLCSLCKMDLQG